VEESGERTEEIEEQQRIALGNSIVTSDLFLLTFNHTFSYSDTFILLSPSYPT